MHVLLWDPPLQVNAGVPQGPVFGHLSFVRYNFNIQSKLFITSLVITEYSTSDIKLLGTDNHLVKENIIQMN